MHLRGRSAFLLLVVFCVFMAPAQASQKPAARLQPHPLNLGDTNADLLYTPVDPCRIIDTRLAGGFMLAGTTRSFFVTGSAAFDTQGGTPGGCGVPTTATAALINFVAVSPDGLGNLKGSAFPNPIPATGSIVNYQALNPVLNVANGIVFPVCDHATASCTFDITLFTNASGTHVVADVLGYFKRFPIEQTITSVAAGAGLTGGGTSGLVTLAANFTTSGGMNGTAVTVARGDHKHYARTVLVNSGGTRFQNGTALLDAVASITAAGINDPYLLKIEPGVYDIGGNTLNLAPYVDVEGSGRDITTIVHSPGLISVSAAGYAQIRDLTVESTDPNGTWGIYDTATSFSLKNVRVTVSSASPTGQSIGVFVSSASPMTAELNDVVIDVNAGDARGLGFHSPGGTATLYKAQVTATGDTAITVSSDVDAVLSISESTINARGGASGAWSVQVDDGTTVVTDSSIGASASGGGGAFGINCIPSTGGARFLSVENSRIFGTNYTIYGSSFMVRVGGSRLAGGLASGTSLTCAGVWDENFVFSASTCP